MKRWMAVLAVLALLGCQQQAVRQPLLLSEEQIASARHRAATDPVAAPAAQALLAWADSLAATSPTVPPRGGMWGHYYSSPLDGTPLRRGKRIGTFRWEHLDAQGRVFLGDSSQKHRDFDGIQIKHWHDTLASHAARLAQAYLLKPEPAYVRWVQQLLLQYIALYPTLPHNAKNNNPAEAATDPNRGRVTSQALDEACWIMRLNTAVDLLWDQLPTTLRNHYRDSVALPATAYAAGWKLGVHNIQCWENAAMLYTGMLFGHDSLVHAALNDTANGLLKNLEAGFTPDGLWYERSTSYHFYTLMPLLYSAQLLQHSHPQVGQQLLAALRSPLALALPGYSFPQFNDCRAGSLLAFTGFYQWAWATHADSSALPLLHHAAQPQVLAQGGKHSNPLSNPYLCFPVLFGQQFPPAARPAGRSTVLHGSQQAVLRHGPLSLYALWEPHVGYHSHQHQLQACLYHGGQPLLLESGMTNYGSPLQAGWFRTSLAHNTLTLPGQRMNPAPAQLLDHDSSSHTLQLSAPQLYPGVAMLRSASLPSPSQAMLVDQVQAHSPQDLILAYHLPPVSRVQGGSMLPDTAMHSQAPFSFLQGLHSMALPLGDTLHIHHPTAHYSLVSAQPCQVLWAQGHHATGLHPVLLLRHRGTHLQAQLQVNAR